MPPLKSLPSRRSSNRLRACRWSRRATGDGGVAPLAGRRGPAVVRSAGVPRRPQFPLRFAGAGLLPGLRRGLGGLLAGGPTRLVLLARRGGLALDPVGLLGLDVLGVGHRRVVLIPCLYRLLLRGDVLVLLRRCLPLG